LGVEERAQLENMDSSTGLDRKGREENPQKTLGNLGHRKQDDSKSQLARNYKKRYI
jgi:hypothetical protein